MSYMNQNQDMYKIEMRYATVSEYVAAVQKDIQERYVYIPHIVCVCVYVCVYMYIHVCACICVFVV